MDADIVTALLRHFQWAPSQKVPGRYEAWSREGDDDHEVIVPLNPERDDYQKLLDRAARLLVAHHGPEVNQLATVLRGDPKRLQSDLDICNGAYLQFRGTGDECYISNMHPDEMRAFIRALGDHDRAVNGDSRAKDMNGRLPTQDEWDTKNGGYTTCQWCGLPIAIYTSDVWRYGWRSHYDVYIKHVDVTEVPEQENSA